MGGMNSAGFMPGEVGGSMVQTGLQAADWGIKAAQVGTNLTNAWNIASTAWTSASAAWSAAPGIVQGVGAAASSLGSSATAAVSGINAGISTLGAALGYIGAAVQGVMIILDKNKTNLGKAIQTATLAVGAFFGPVGIIVASLINWIEDMFGVFEKGLSNFAQKRMEAASEASLALETVSGVYRSALDVGTPEAVQRALATGQGGSGQSVRTELMLPASLAAEVGLTGQQIGHMVVTQWATITMEQFGKILDLFAAQPDLLQNIRGSGDVPYLSEEDALQIAVGAKNSAIALLQAFQAMRQVNEELNALTTGITQALDLVLAEDLAAMFAERVTIPFREGMLAAIMSGGTSDEVKEEMDELTAKLKEQTQAWGAFGQLLTKGVDIEDALAGIADIGPKFTAAMQPQYDAIQSALVIGNTRTAATLTANAERLQALWAGFGDSLAKSVDIGDALAGLGDLGATFEAAISPQYAAIEAALITGNTRVAMKLGKAVDQQLALWAAFGEVVAQAIDVDTLLAPIEGLGERAHAQMTLEYNEILETLIAGNTTLARTLIVDFQKQLQAFATIGTTITALQSELVTFSGSTEEAIAALIGMREQLDRTAIAARTAFESALGSGDLARIAATSEAYHAAVLDSLTLEQQLIDQTTQALQEAQQAAEAERQAVEAVREAINNTLTASVALVQLGVKIAQLEASGGGGLTTITNLTTALSEMSRSASTAEERLWAVHHGLLAIITVLPDLIRAFGAVDDPRRITEAVVSGASLFLPALEAAINAATGGEKLALRQQQAQIFQDLANAAINGVNQWATQAIEATRGAAQVQLDALTVLRDAQLAAIDAEIEAIEAQTRIEQDARRAEMDGLRDRIATAREWKSAIDSMSKAIQALKVGPLGPGNPADKLRMAQESFAKALLAYQANPTAQGLGDLQALAQSVLSLAEPIMSKPSPAFQTLSANMIRQLEAAQALADQQAEDADLLQAQLDALEALDKAILDAADKQIKALRADRAQVMAAFEARTRAIQNGLDAQIKAIEKAAKEEVAAINLGLKTALEANAVAQAGLIGEQKVTNEALLKALKSTEFGAGLGDIATYAAQRQDVAIGILDAMLKALNRVIPAERGMPRVTEGLYHLHDDEMVLPEHMAKAVREAGGFSVLDRGIRSAAQGAGIVWDTPPNADRATAYAILQLNMLQSQIDAARLTYENKFLKNPYVYSAGKRYDRFSADELAREKVKVDAIVAPLLAQQAGILASLPPPRSTAPPPTEKTPPPTDKTPPPPVYVPGPSWLTRESELAPMAGTSPRATAGGDAAGTQIIIKLDSKVIGEATLPTVQRDARGGVIRQIIIETAGKK